MGFAFKFPDGVDSDDTFWDMIWKGRSATMNFPGDRLNIDGFYHPDKSRQSNVGLLHTRDSELIDTEAHQQDRCM